MANGTPGIPVATGALTDTDVDNLANTFQTVTSPTASDSGYGNYTVDVTGHWNYTLDNTNGAVEGLSNTQTLTDTFNVHTIDGTAQVVTVTIHGTNDVPVITGTATGSVTEDVNLSGNNLSTSGALGITDVDQGQSNFTIQASTPGSNGYGTFALAADGHWTYTADDHQTAIQQLGASEFDHRQLHGGVERRHGQPAGDGNDPRHQRRAGDRRAQHGRRDRGHRSCVGPHLDVGCAQHHRC